MLVLHTVYTIVVVLRLVVSYLGSLVTASSTTSVVHVSAWRIKIWSCVTRQGGRAGDISHSSRAAQTSNVQYRFQYLLVDHVIDKLGLQNAGDYSTCNIRGTSGRKRMYGADEGPY